MNKNKIKSRFTQFLFILLYTTFYSLFFAVFEYYVINMYSILFHVHSLAVSEDDTMKDLTNEDKAYIRQNIIGSGELTPFEKEVLDQMLGIENISPSQLNKQAENLTKERMNELKIYDGIWFQNKMETITQEKGTVQTYIAVNDKEQTFSDFIDTDKEDRENNNIYTISDKYSNYYITVDYTDKSISKGTIKEQKRTKNTIVNDELIITAVPSELKVYNDLICKTGKTYECKWLFKDGTDINITGDIQTHVKTLNKGGGVWNKSQLANTISAVFSDLTRTKEHDTIVYNTPNKKGFYYDQNHDKIITVKHEIQRPSKDQLTKALDILDNYASHFGYYVYNPDGEKGKDYIETSYHFSKEENNVKTSIFKVDSTRLAVFLRWCLNAPFHFVRKQYGRTDDKYIFLSGESGAGKTYGYTIAGLFMLGVENPKEYLVSGGSNSKAQISKNLGKGTFPVFIDEGDRIFNQENLTSMLKHSVQGLNSREVTDMEVNELTTEKALAPLGFTANNIFQDTEKGGLSNRVIILPFYIRDIPSPENRKKFIKEFNTNYTPHDKRQSFKWIGYEFQARIIENPDIYKYHDADTVVKEFFKDICVECERREILDWINNDMKIKNGEDDIKERHDELAYTMKAILNKAMTYTLIKHDESSMNQTKLIDDSSMTWKEKLIALAESQKIAWLGTNKSRSYFIITKGVLNELKKENKNITISNLEELRDILICAKYTRYDIGRYKINKQGKRKDTYHSLKVDVEVLSDLYDDLYDTD